MVNLVPERAVLEYEIRTMPGRLPSNICLLAGVGNCPEQRCGTALFGYTFSLRATKISGFPVKFPVGRESARRQVRAALCRQCGSPVRTETFLFVITGRIGLKIRYPIASSCRIVLYSGVC
jgi:hypothetical protein